MIETRHERRYWVYRNGKNEIVAEFCTIQECGVWEATLLDTQMHKLVRRSEYRSLDYKPEPPKEF